METVLFLLISTFLILIIPFASFMIARKVYRAMTAKQNRWAMLVSSLTFLLSFFLISSATLIIYLYNVDFSR